MAGVLRAATAGMVAVALSAAVSATTFSARASSPVTIGTDDGLAMTLSGSGAVSSVGLGGREVSGGARTPLFSVRKVSGTPNLVTNPGLEADADGNRVPDGWRLMNGTYKPAWVNNKAHRGNRSVRFRVPTTATTSTLQTTVPVRPGVHYKADGWIRTSSVQPTAATAEPATGSSPVRLKVQQLVDTRVVATEQAFGYTGTARWHRKYVGFKTLPGVTSVRMMAQVVRGSGKVWFDDISFRELFRPSWGPGRGTVTPTAEGAQFQGVANNMDIDATVASHGDHLRVGGFVGSPTNTQTAFQLRVSLPLDAQGWTWWDDPRRSRTVQAGGHYDYLTEWNAQQTSRYPLNTLSDGSDALSMGLPLDQPRLARAHYADGRLHYTFDLGVAPETSIFGGARVPFSLVLFRSPPDWGFRGALDRYTDIFPAHFQRRTDVAREGGWVGRFDKDKLTDTWDDFGLGLNMIALAAGNDIAESTWGKDWIRWDNERGIYTTAYNHHWGFKHLNVDNPVIPYYGVEMGRLRADARLSGDTYDEQRRRDRSIASLNSGARDNNGRYLFARYKTYLQHYENLSPLTGVLDWHEVSRTYQMEKSIEEAEAAGGTLDALHLDSVSGMRRWGAADDYHRPHWANARHGLTFSYDSGRVVDRLTFGVAAQVEFVSDYAHDRGMFLSANFNSSDARSGAWFGAHAIDYVGIERGLPEKAGETNDPYTTVDKFALFKRSLAGQRPMSTIDPDCNAHSGPEVEKRFHQTLLYGIYMGCGGAATWTEEQRVMFARYTPLLREVNAGGWEVVTGAKPSTPDVLVERFGSMEDDGAVWLAVHNPTGTARDVTVTVEDEVLGGSPAGSLSAEDRITGAPVALAPANGGLAFSDTLQAHTTALVRLRPAG